MSRRRGAWSLVLLFGIAQSCTNDFDQFDASGTSVRGGSSSSGGSIALAGTTTRGGSTGLGGALPVGGTTTSRAGTSSTGGHAPAAAGAAGALADAGATGVAGAGSEPIPCGGPCTLGHATAACVEDACAVSACDDSWGDCNALAEDGCEHAVRGDIANCGACGRACDTQGVASLSCENGACSSSCEPGFANCVQNAMPDDGCETAVTSNAAHCGGCNNKCPNGFVCLGGQCSCDSKNDCGNGNGVECSNHSCQCSLTACRPGERCRDNGGTKVCSCNGSTSPGCAANEFCCGAGGCTDVLSNADNCGSCGRACTPGFSCSEGSCRCDSAADCGGVDAPEVGAGGAPAEGGASGGSGAPASSITCVQGLCACNGNLCTQGQRCLADGHCG